MSARRTSGEKDRLDVRLVKSNKVPSPEIARGLILAGRVFVDGRIIDKPGTRIRTDASLEIQGEIHPYASRGGKKLEAAIEHFHPNVKGTVAIDVGASTGGFTDCLLRYGVARVYAIDVGYGQLAWKLRQDPRVQVFERTNFRYFDPDQLDEKPAIATVDVSFISLGLIIPTLGNTVTENAEIIALIKPQFEADRDEVPKGGVVKDPKIHQEVIENVTEYVIKAGFTPHEVIESPLLGPAGNKEFLLYAAR